MIVRAMATTDLPLLLYLQEAGAMVGMADVFPQDQYSFPRGAVLDRWRDERRAIVAQASDLGVEELTCDHLQQPIRALAASSSTWRSQRIGGSSTRSLD